MAAMRDWRHDLVVASASALAGLALGYVLRGNRLVREDTAGGAAPRVAVAAPAVDSSTERRLVPRLHASNRPALLGTCCISPSAHFLSATVAAGADFAFLDTEHIALDRAALSWMCRAYGAMGVAPIVRVPEPEPYRVCMALDGGAVGIVAPYIESVEQVCMLVGAAKLRPLKGERLQRVLRSLPQLRPTAGRWPAADAATDSVGGPSITARSAALRTALEAEVGAATANYIMGKNAQVALFINVESTLAVDRLDALLGVPGIDGVFIGPADLSVQLGCPRQWGDPRLAAAIAGIIRSTAAANLAVGCHYSFGRGVEKQAQWVAEAGCNLVIHSSDLKLTADHLKADFDAIRKAIGSQEGAPASSAAMEVTTV